MVFIWLFVKLLKDRREATKGLVCFFFLDNSDVLVVDGEIVPKFNK